MQKTERDKKTAKKREVKERAIKRGDGERTISREKKGAIKNMKRKKAFPCSVSMSNAKPSRSEFLCGSFHLAVTFSLDRTHR